MSYKTEKGKMEGRSVGEKIEVRKRFKVGRKVRNK